MVIGMAAAYSNELTWQSRCNLWAFKLKTWAPFTDIEQHCVSKTSFFLQVIAEIWVEPLHSTLYYCLTLEVSFTFHCFTWDKLVGFSSQDFKLGFSSEDVQSVFSRSLLAIQLQRIDQFVHKPSRRFPVHCSQKKNSCRGGVSFFAYLLCDITI